MMPEAKSYSNPLDKLAARARSKFDQRMDILNPYDNLPKEIVFQRELQAARLS